nr:ficolin-1-A-like [Drosophila bipectinata]
MKLRGMKPFDGPCASGPEWIVVQRRFDGSVDFNRTWNEYKKGFGNIQGEYFIGLDRLHLMTTSVHHELCVRVADFDGVSAYAHYTHFEIGNEEESYELKSLDGYSGTAQNYLETNKNMKFSTIDRDNDKVRRHLMVHTTKME